MHILPDSEFLAHFWQYGPDALLGHCQKTKSDFFLQKDLFSFSEQVVLVVRKIGCSNNPKLLWKILLLRPTVGDFHSWLFWIPWGSPFTL